MFNRIFAIHTTDQDLVERGRLLKGTALLLFAAAVVMLALGVHSLADLRGYWPTGVVVVVSPLVFGLAHQGYVRFGGVLLAIILLVAIITTQNTAEMTGMRVGLATILPTLVTGLVLNSTAMVVVGGITLVARVVAQTVFHNTPGSSIVNDIIVMGASLTLLWVLFRTLERAVTRARAQAKAARTSEQTLSAQQAAMETTNAELTAANTQMSSLLDLVRDLETPAIPLVEGVLVLPLVGHVDTRRAARLSETALEAVHEHRARVVIIDITGVSVVDTAVAQRIGQLAQAIRLLGARVLLTGIRAEVAQTIVAQELDFSQIQTAGRLQDGVARVLADTSFGTQIAGLTHLN